MIEIIGKCEGEPTIEGRMTELYACLEACVLFRDKYKVLSLNNICYTSCGCFDVIVAILQEIIKVFFQSIWLGVQLSRDGLKWT